MLTTVVIGMMAVATSFVSSFRRYQLPVITNVSAGIALFVRFRLDFISSLQNLCTAFQQCYQGKNKMSRYVAK